MRLALAAALLAPSAAAAFPDPPPWDAAGGEGCAACHFDVEPIAPSPALAIEGLPDALAPGTTYALELRLADPEMARAGFLISAEGRDGAVGRFVSVDGRTEAKDGLARSTAAGSRPAPSGSAAWRLEWVAPDRVDGPVRFVLRANAADGDGSPFGDRTHLRSRAVPPAR